MDCVSVWTLTWYLPCTAPTISSQHSICAAVADFLLLVILRVRVCVCADEWHGAHNEYRATAMLA